MFQLPISKSKLCAPLCGSELVSAFDFETSELWARNSSCTRVSVAIQLTSHVLPPSSENACSKRHEVEVMSDQTFRTRIILPSNSSWSKNSPRPFLNSPTVGWPRVPTLLFAKLMLHWWDSGLYRRRDKPSMWPAGPSTSSSTRLARPFQTGRTTDVPSYSTHVSEPVKGCWRREM